MNILKQFALFITICDCSTLVLAVTNVNNVTCDYNPKKCTGGFCKIINPRGTMKYINAGCYFFKPTDNLFLYMTILRKVKNQYLSAMKPIEQDFCNFENAKTDNYFFSRIMALTGKSIGIKCPIQGNITYSRIPCFMHFTQGFFPYGEYILYSKINQKLEYVLEMNISFAIRAKDFF